MKKACFTLQTEYNSTRSNAQTYEAVNRMAISTKSYNSRKYSNYNKNINDEAKDEYLIVSDEFCLFLPKKPVKIK